MKYVNKDELKANAVQYYLQGKNLIEISKILGCSRNYLGKLIKDDCRVREYRNNKTVKVNKLKRQHRMNISIPSEYWEKIGIVRDSSIEDYVNVSLDEESKKIIIKKHKK